MSANENAQALAVREPKAGAIEIGGRGLELRSLEDMYRFAQYVAVTQFCPKDFKSPEAILVAIQYGYELGLTPMQSLQNLAVINGRPSTYGDIMLGLVRASGLLEDFDEGYSGDGDDYHAWCYVKRVGMKKAQTETFSVRDAKLADLWQSGANWKKYPRRMLKFRARGFALRDQFADVLKGIISREEAEDYDGPRGTTFAEDSVPRVVEMPKTRVAALKERLAGAAKPEHAAALEAQAPALFDEEPEAADDAEEIELVSQDQLNQLRAIIDQTGFDMAPILGELGVTELRLIPAVAFEDVYDAVAYPPPTEEEPVPTVEAAASLRDAIDDAGMDRKAILKQFGVKTLEQLTPSQLKDAWTIVRAYAKK